MTEQLVRLTYLADETAKLEREITGYLEQYPSARVAHHSRNLELLRVMLIAEKGEVISREQKARDRAAAAEEREYSAHEKEMARRMNITPAQFREHQDNLRLQLEQPPPPTEIAGAMRPDGSFVGGGQVDDMEDPNDV